MIGIWFVFGVVWIVLVFVEYFGVIFGFGYVINDVCDMLEYDCFVVIVIIIGIIGFLLDFFC